MLMAAGLAACGGGEETLSGPVGRLAPAVLAAETDRAALLAASCSGCHAGGRDEAAAIPGLEGLGSAALLDLLDTYRTDTAGTSVMHRIARGYGEDELALIADYLGGAGP